MNLKVNNTRQKPRWAFNLFLEVCHTQQYEEKQFKTSCHREDSFFFEMFASN